MPNKVQNKEHYLKIAQNLDNIANLFRQLTNSEVTLTHVAKTLNMKASQLGPAMFNDASLQSKLKLKEDSLKIIKLSMSPYEKLIADIYGINIKDIIVTVSKSQEDDINNILNSLTNRQLTIITALYGLDGKEPSTQSQVGHDINITSERVNQIKQKILRIVRYKLTAFYNYPHEFDLNPESPIGHIRLLEKEIIQLNEKLSYAESIVTKLQNQLQKKININNDTISEFQSIDIAQLNLSVRAYNSLTRAGIKTLLDIALLDEMKLRQIRNLGNKSITEIKNALHNYGFELGQNKI